MNVAAALQVARLLPKEAVVVAIICDTGERYLTKHHNDEWLKEDDTLLRLAISAKEKKQVKKYREIRARNLHKMNSIPVFKKPK
jgi:cystathionine beta-synthase